jgi:hypothetical protein
MLFTTDKLNKESEHGQQLKVDYDLVVNENAHDTMAMANYYSYVGAAFGPDLEEVGKLMNLSNL